jgi:lipid-A-disaccharide synthase
VKELIQHELTAENLTTELQKLLQDENHRANVKRDLDELWTILSPGGAASAKTARIVFDFVAQNRD